MEDPLTEFPWVSGVSVMKPYVKNKAGIWLRDFEEENIIPSGGFFVADGINSVGDYNSPPGGCRRRRRRRRRRVSVCPHLFFTFHDWITSKRFELLS